MSWISGSYSLALGLVGRDDAIGVWVEKGVAMMGRASGEVVLDLAEVWGDTAADCRNAAKLRTASRRPSGAFEESAEVIMLCSGTEEAIGSRAADEVLTACQQAGSRVW